MKQEDIYSDNFIDEERRLIKQAQDGSPTEQQQAMTRLFQMNQGWLFKQAVVRHRIHRKTLEFEDCQQMVNEAYAIAIRKYEFENSNGSRLTSFANYRILERFNTDPLRRTFSGNFNKMNRLRTILHRDRRFRAKSASFLNYEDRQLLAGLLDSTTNEVEELLMQLVANTNMLRLHHLNEDDDEMTESAFMVDPDSLIDYHEIENSQNFAGKTIERAFQKYIRKLRNKSNSEDRIHLRKTIFYERIVADDETRKSLQELSEKFGITRERIRQLEVGILENVASIVKSEFKSCPV